MLIRPETSVVAVIDVQERLIAAMNDAPLIVRNIIRLAEAAKLLGVRRVVTEQYPKGLGKTPPELAHHLPEPESKMRFSCCGTPGFDRAVEGMDCVVLAGFETHVCVLQTAIDLLSKGHNVLIVLDAITSIRRIDHETAIRRMESSGAIVTTTESVLFEWCASAEHPRFQEIRQLILSE